MCDVCGAEKPSEMVTRTAIETIAPMEADVCASCRIVQDHELPEDVCMQCGDDVGAGFYLELEFPLGVSGAPGRLAGRLCADCAGWVACDINYNGVDADQEAHEELLAVLDEETLRMNALEGRA